MTSKDDGNTVDGSGGARKASDSPKPAKKRKLTVAEREEQQKGREAKEREKAEKVRESVVMIDRGQRTGDVEF